MNKNIPIILEWSGVIFAIIYSLLVALNIGYEFLGLDEKNCMEVKYEDKISRYELIHVLEFNSTRKRMSVIIRDIETN